MQVCMPSDGSCDLLIVASLHAHLHFLVLPGELLRHAFRLLLRRLFCDRLRRAPEDLPVLLDQLLHVLMDLFGTRARRRR